MCRMRFFPALLAAMLALPCAGRAQEQPGAPSLPNQSAPEQVPAETTLPSPGMPPAPPEDTPIDSQNAVRLSDVEGSVRLVDSNGKLSEQAMRNMVVLPGMSIATAEDGRAELQFSDGSIARVTPNSGLALEPLHAGSPGHLLLKATKGLSYYELVPGGFSVQVGPLVARSGNTVSESALLRVNLDSSPYQAATLRGAVQLEDAVGSVAFALETGQTTRIDPTAASDYDIDFELATDTWDAWNTDREKTQAQLTGAAQPGERGLPGWSDLSYYGTWYDVPGEGLAWAPDGVGQNFDPYGSGAWGYTTTAGYGAGYSWASSYPWGWLPYHCGLWNYYQSDGWMWQPSNCGWGQGAGWYPYRGIGRSPRGYFPPGRPRPPHGILPVQTLIAVHRGSQVQFRALGAARPMPRAMVVAGQPLLPMQAETGPLTGPQTGSRYQPGSVGEFRSTPASGAISAGIRGLQPGQTGYETTARIPSPLGSVAPAGRLLEGPHMPACAPPARMSAPPSAAPAVHLAAPPGRGR